MLEDIHYMHGDQSMSGSISYTVSAGHVYQRKFANDELAAALRGFHLYCVSRRPATRIDESSIRESGKSTSLEIVVFGPDNRRVRERIPLSFAWNIESATFKTYLDGSYFSVHTHDGELLHGDAWALATFAMQAQKGVADQEILYIGQAYGKRGERSAYNRTKEHSKVQRIYEEHAGEGWDIFVSPVAITETSCGTWDHLPADDRGFDLNGVLALSGDKSRGGEAPKLSVDLVEHALIAAFQPPYNVQLLEWAAGSPTSAMRKIQGWRFRLISVTLDGIDGMARYYTSACPSRDRGQTFYLGLTESPKRPVLDLVNPSDWDFEMQMHIQAVNRMAQWAEMSQVILRWFGNGAPALRKPPEIVFE